MISASGVTAAFAAKAATTTIPIVFGVAEDPVRLGLVASLARPGGNLTGINFLTAELVAKRLELLRELVPAATRVAVLVNPANTATSPTRRIPASISNEPTPKSLIQMELLLLFLVLIVLVESSSDQETRANTAAYSLPYCRNTIAGAATVCEYCHRDVEPTSPRITRDGMWERAKNNPHFKARRDDS